jgi:SAM-dependent methyltransferase
MHAYDKDPLTAMEAVSAAQWLAFAPLAFHAVSVMRDRNVLDTLAKGAPQGCTLDEVVQATGLQKYGVRVLLEAGLGLHIVWRTGESFHLGKLGHFLLNDKMTRVNFDFTRDVCYAAAAHLDASVTQGKPAGLQVLGPWATLYEGLSALPEPALASWHAFDHFYSDLAFPAACDRLAKQPPARLLDIGCNTGKWAEYCLSRLPELHVGLVDLPDQLVKASARLKSAGVAHRSSTHPVNLLDAQARLPKGFDLVWMSQFLDCFSDDQVVDILHKVRECLAPGGRIWILELFWDRQRFEAAAFSLQQTSLYFTCVANGNSQMYESSVFLGLVEKSGLTIDHITDGVGGYHTLLECRLPG